MTKTKFPIIKAISLVGILSPSCGKIVEKEVEEKEVIVERNINNQDQWGTEYMVNDGDGLALTMALPEDVADQEGASFDWRKIEDNAVTSNKFQIFCKNLIADADAEKLGFLYLTLTQVSGSSADRAEFIRTPLKCRGDFKIKISNLTKGKYQLGIYVANKARDLVFKGKSEVFAWDAGRVKVQMSRVFPETKDIWVDVIFPKKPTQKFATVTCHFSDASHRNTCTAWQALSKDRDTAKDFESEGTSDRENQGVSNAEGNQTQPGGATTTTTTDSPDTDSLTIAPYTCIAKHPRKECTIKIPVAGTYYVSGGCSYTDLTERQKVSLRLGAAVDLKFEGCTIKPFSETEDAAVTWEAPTSPIVATSAN